MIERISLTPAGVMHDIPLYRFDGSDYIILQPIEEYDFIKDEMATRANELNLLSESNPDVLFYAYYVNRPSNMDWYMEAGFRAYDYASFFAQKLQWSNIHFGEFTIYDADDFMEYFYKLDHHQNHRGSQRSYEEVYEMLSADLALSPMKTPVSERDYGDLRISYYNTAELNPSREEMDIFQTYEYDLGEYSEYVNGKKMVLGLEREYADGEITDDPYFLHQLAFYGGQTPIVTIEFDNPEGKNLLLLADSQGRPIRKLLASHFKTTYHLDRLQTNEEDLDAFIKEHNIDVVLIMGQTDMFQKPAE